MSSDAGSHKLPEAHCNFCSTKTPHLYERLAVNGRLTYVLECNAEQPRELK